MTDTLRTRLTDLIYGTVSWRDVNVPVAEEVADAVIAVLGRRQCQRCRMAVPLDGFPMPQEGSDVMRPFCWSCTSYVEWATS